ncbi:MAG: hypothetical protein ABH956_00145 [Candidatus Nealsonbacteria bacterium]
MGFITMKRFIIFIIVSGLLLALAGFWFWQRNPYSKDILKIEIIGPEKSSILEEVEYTVKYKNNGNVRLENPRLIFEFPENTLSVGEDDEQKSLKRIEIGPEELGDIYPGEEKTFKFKGILFGKEGEAKTAKVWLLFSPKNLKAKYESTTSFTTVVDAIPLTFDFDLSSRIEAGRDFKFSLNYYSSLDHPLSNLGIKIEYPNGFEFISSNPESLGKNEWEIPLLNKAEGGRIEIGARLMGEIREQKIFKASIGVWQENEFIALKEITRGVELVQPHISIYQRINGSSDYTAKPGDLLHYEIFFRNINEEPFTDLFLVTRLDGKAFDFNSVKTDFGQFSAGDNSIIWDWRDVSKLKFLGQGEEGKVEFWINLKDFSVSSPQEKNFLLKDSVLVSQVKEEFETKISSNLVISQKGFFKDEVFGNSGPIPPEVDKKTTYTIIWQAKNYYNDVKNAKVKAILPSNVELTGEIFPETEASKFSFDQTSREIIWILGDNNIFASGTGILSPAPSISFQVILTPNSSQRGKTARIIGDARIVGEDQWTDDIIDDISESIDTSLPDDSSVSGNNGIVK